MSLFFVSAPVPTLPALTVATVEAAPLPQKEASSAQTVDLDSIITRDAARYRVSRSMLYRTLECESTGFKDVALQSEVPDMKGPDGRENSWGLAQIDLDFHPDISKTQAQDPVFAVDYMAKEFAAGQAAHWHCYTLIQKGKY